MAERPWPNRPSLYPILDVAACAARGIAPLDLLAIWLDAGVRIVQLRAKTMASGAMLTLADAMGERCRAADAAFIVNDRVDVARMTGAAGVHVGQDDLPPADARRLMGDGMIVGCSTHNEEQLTAALAQPVSYVAIGPVFATVTKANPDPAVGLEMIARASAAAHDAGRPLVAIGGITLATAREVIDAGADAIAVIGDLLVGDPAARVLDYLQALG
jgi:thiamine-phosphate pyrophosphorylase